MKLYTNMMRKLKYKLIPTLVMCMLVQLQALRIMAQSDNLNSERDTVKLKSSQLLNEELTFNTVSNSIVYGDKFALPTANINNMLFGRLPELIVKESTGEPGYDAASLSIRGRATLGNTSVPVYIDGFRTKSSYLQYMSASEIESIEVLKDAVALAPFGLKGANGILWVTTKRGENQEPEIKFNLSSGIQKPISLIKPLGTKRYTSLYNEANSNDNGGVWSEVYTPEMVGSLPDVDWYDEVLSEDAFFSNADFSVSGGNEKARYFILFGYMDQKGLYDVPNNDTLSNAGISRYNIRTNLDLKISKSLEAKFDISARIESRQYPNRSAGNLWNEMASYPSSIYSVRNDDGTWTGTPIYNNNPVASTNALGRVSTHDRTFQTNFQLKQKLDDFVEGLYVSGAMSLNSWTRDGASNTRNYTRFIDSVRQTNDESTPYSRSENSGTNQWLYQNYEGKLGYDKIFGKHSISTNASALYNIYTADFSEFPNDGNVVIYKHMNIGGAANYVYENKYAATLSYAFSGSDNFHPDNKWNLYPALALAWNVSNEDFLSNSLVVDKLKLRASAGLTGWDPVGERRYLWERYYNYSGGLRTGNAGGQWRGGLGLSYVENTEITAEKGTKFDVGIEAGLFGKLDLSLDLFLEKRSGIILQDWSVPVTAGLDNPAYRNIGEVTNKGFEFTGTFSDNINEFSYALSANVGVNSNTIDYMAEVITVESAARTGNSINSQFGYTADGFYSTNDFDAAGNLVAGLPKPTFGDVQPGDVKYKDMDGDTFINTNDISLIANPEAPKMVYALSVNLAYKGFDFFALLQGTKGSEINLLRNGVQTLAFVDNGNAYPIAENRWAYYPDQGIDTRESATYPRLSLDFNSNNYRTSTLWIRNGDYLKLRNIELGYTYKPAGNMANYMKSLRLALVGINLLTFSNLYSEMNIDPEITFGHPAMKSTNISLTVVF